VRERRKAIATMRMKRITLSIAVILFLCASVGQAQTVSPMGGIGTVQVFDNTGTFDVNAVIYFYQAGTTTQQATYTDSGGTTQNPNPMPIGSRATIWLTTSAFYKIVWCLQNDGAFCAPADVLASIDNVPGGATSSGGGGSSPFTGIFISSSASPSTSGILRLASSDSVCWRNASGSTNLCISKDSNDLLTWAGGSLKLPEVGAPSATAGFDVLWADNTAHRWKMANNGGGAVQIVGSGVDINTSDQVTQLHFGAAATPLSGTAPTTGQNLQWNGSAIVGVTPTAAATEATFGGGDSQSTGAGNQCGGAPGNACGYAILANAHTLTRFTVQLSTAPSGCATNAVVGVRDMTSSTNLTSITIVAQPVGFRLDSGAISIAMTAGHEFAAGLLTAAGGCGTFPTIGSSTAVYQ